MLAACHISPASPDLHPALADLWVAAWTRAMPQIDFEARRDWMRARLVDRPAAGDLIAEARFLRQGGTLAVIDVLIRDADGVLVTQATGTYALPRQKSA